MDNPPIPGEIRMIDGRPKVWIPTPPPVIPHPIHPPPVKYSRITKTLYQGNYTISTGQSTPISLLGKGIVREAAIVLDQKFGISIKVDGVDILNGNSDFDKLASVSQYSNTISVRYDDPDYVLMIGKVIFDESFDVVVWPGVSATVKSATCTYELCVVV